jgi:hypothetical protein
VKLDDALSGETGLSGVRWLLAGHASRGVLRTELATLLGDVGALGRCRLRRVKFKPGRELRAYLDIVVRGTRSTTRPVAVSWRPTRKFSEDEDVEEIEAEVLRYESAAPFRGLYSELPSWGMRLTVAPLDPVLPELGRLSDPNFADEVLGAPRKGSAVSVLRYFPGTRHVLRYDPGPNESLPDEASFLKIYSDDTPDRLLWVSHAASEWLTSKGNANSVLSPTPVPAHRRAVVYPHADGVPLSRLFTRSSSSAARRLSEAGSLLHVLQQTPLDRRDDLEPHRLDHQLHVILRAGRHITPLCRPAGLAVRSLLDRAEEIYARLPNEPLTLVHGDFKADHLFVTQRKLSLLDLDNCRLADPAFDAGKMLADLHWWYGMRGRRGQGDAQQAFLHGYLQGNERHRLARARLWEALFLAKRSRPGGSSRSIVTGHSLRGGSWLRPTRCWGAWKATSCERPRGRHGAAGQLL